MQVNEVFDRQFIGGVAQRDVKGVTQDLDAGLARKLVGRGTDANRAEDNEKHGRCPARTPEPFEFAQHFHGALLPREFATEHKV